MYVVGLTGPIAAGKSTVAQMFREQGAEVWDADVAVARLYAKKSPLTATLARVCETDILDEKGAISRSKLKHYLAEDPAQAMAKLTQLEAHIFPALQAAWFAWVKKRKSALLVLEAPLLFEADMAKFCNEVVVCQVAEELRKARAEARAAQCGGEMNAFWWQMMTSRQMTAEAYAAKADVVLACTETAPAQTVVASYVQRYLTEAAA